jgi:hypothetical protein
MDTLPPTSELFAQRQLIERHPGILNLSRVQWAVRNRAKNGLEGVYESKGGELLIHEPTFLLWFLGLQGRAKPRAQRRKRRARSNGT